MGRLDNKVAVVTGGSLGLGKATCELFAEEGAMVAIIDVLDDQGMNLAASLQKKGFKVGYFHADVSDEKSVKKAFSDIKDTFGNVDILVNNAGVSGPNKPTHELTEEEWDKVMNINVKGVFLCTKYAIPDMLETKKGSIINLSSIYGLVGGADLPPYHASKGAVRLMSKNDALIYAPNGIRVNSIHPGFIWTPMVENHLKENMPDPKEAKTLVGALHPLGHMGEPLDIAYGALYLASDESKFVTGSELVIDGGYTAR